MRHKGVDKEVTRSRVMSAASREFRKSGYAGVGVDALAKGADVTSGAIYAHFGSKAGIFNAVLIAGLDEVIEGIPQLQAKFGEAWISEFVDYYLGAKHREDMENVCAMASLTPEVIHFGGEIHIIYEEKMQEIARIIAKGLSTHGDEHLNKAWVILSLLTGGVNIARAMKTKKAAEKIAGAVKKSIELIL